MTRTVNEITELLLAKDHDQKALKIAKDMLEKTMADLESWDQRVQDQMLDDGASDDAIDEEQKSIEKYKRLYLSAWADMEQSNVSTEEIAGSVTGSVGNDGKKRKFHLPEVKLKTFGGNLKEWLGWWSQFEKIHLDCELHDTDKFQYLSQSMVQGTEAKAIVESYPQTEGNYGKAVQALQERFGRQDLLLQVYVRELLTLVIGNVTSTEKIPLPQLFVKLESHLRCLAELNLDKADPATWLFPLVESSLSEEIQRAWQRSAQSKIDGSTQVPKKSRLDLLMEFMKSEVQCEQQISLAQQGFQSSSKGPSMASRVSKMKYRPMIRTNNEIPTAAGLLTLQTTGCGFCGKPHDSEKCFKIQKMTLEEKFKIVRDKNLCFQCLYPGHVRRACNKQVNCTGCSGRHHRVMCPESQEEKNRKTGRNRYREQSSYQPHFKRQRTDDGDGKDQQQNDQVTFVRTFNQNSNLCSRTVLLNSLKVRVKDQHGRSTTVRMIVDNGSQRSYVNPSTCKAGRGIWVGNEWLQNVLFGGKTTSPEKFPRHELIVYGIDGGKMNLELLEKKEITGKLCGVPDGPWIQELARKGIALSDIGDKFSTADILIGNDYWGAIRTGRMVKLACGLVAEETVFGWTLGGPIPNVSTSMIVATMTVCSQEIEKLWTLEAIGIRDPVEVKAAEEENKEALAHFSATVKRETDGRFVVSLPWRSGDYDLPTNRKIAEQRLRSTTHRLVKNQKFAEYHDVFLGWVKEGLIKRVGNVEDGHYIPHRPVFKNSTTTPVRPVFDASCKQGRSPSLNDCLFKGPNLIERIPTMLLRFGEKKVGVSSDIRKAFQMIKVKEDDQIFQRFLWWEDERCTTIVVYQHQRVVFGITSSPFLLGATIQHFLNGLEDKILAEKLKSSFYVDNMVTSVSSPSEYQELRASATKVMADAKMELREWASSFGDDMQNNCEATNQEFVEAKIMNVLRIQWNRETDMLSCVIKNFVFDGVTKRNMLSMVAQVFDPMGYLCPAMIVPKALVQEVWAKKLGWDTEVPEIPKKQFLKWIAELAELNDVKIPRYCQIAGASSWEVHIFVDSSMVAMAAVAFLRTELNGEVAVQFLMAKSRLIPITKPSITRAELGSCVVGVRIGKCITEALNISSDSLTFWCDSSTAIAWIRRNGDWGIFVRNRVREILLNSKPHQWHHVPGSMNPADLPSRGCRPGGLVKSKWWNGPTWLCGPKSGFPNSEPVVDDDEVNLELKKTAVLMTSVNFMSPRFSSYRKNVAIWGWVLRFVNSCRRRTAVKEKYLTIGEMRQAEKVLIGSIQTESFSTHCTEVGGIQIFKDTSGLFRVKTRLSNRKDSRDFIYPVLLPKEHPLVDLLIAEMHRYHGHGGVQFLTCKLREKYWIIHSRRVVRKVLRRCTQCRRHSAKNLEVDPAALPAGRVESSAPFLTTGVDLAGPLFLLDGQKAWVVLYTCAVYRAVYLDVVTTLSTEGFLRSLERFISYYGRPNTVYSDNGTNFVGAVNLFKTVDWEEVRKECDVRQIQWIFNPPTAAWWGGFWERLVRSVKDLLKRILRRSKLSLDELRTCLAGVAATINDRPLTIITEDSEDLIPLTPAMFIRPLMLGHFPELGNMDHLQKSYARMKEVQLQLQNRFRKEYLALLVTKTGKKQQSVIAEGDVVLVGADNRKRFEWPLGVVTELIKGKDGKVRVAKVKTANGSLTRPLQRLFPLEISQDPKLPNQNIERPEQPVVEAEQYTRSGRSSRRPVRYGQWLHLVNSVTG